MAPEVDIKTKTTKSKDTGFASLKNRGYHALE
jgi:hypothetical protein